MHHKALSEEELEAVLGYLESVKNLSACAEVLIQHKVYGLLYTILEEIAQNAQIILDYCVVDE